MEPQIGTPNPGQLLDLANHERDRQFRLFAESISNLAWIANADGWIYWYNQRWYQYTGTTPEQMEGWGWQSVHDPAHLPLVLDRWTTSIATGEPFDMTFPLRRADGEFRSFLTRIMPFKDDQGKVLRWFGTNTDISDELQSAAALRESEQRFRTATQAVNAVLWTNNADGEMRGEQAGWAAFTGQSYDEYQNYGWSNAVHPQDVQPTLEAWQQCVKDHCLFAFEHRVRRHDGQYRLCSIRALPILNDDGSLREWVGVHTDVTEERQTQQTLRETVQELNRQQELVEAAQLIGKVGFWRYQPDTGVVYLSKGCRHLLNLPHTGEVTEAEAFASFHPEDIPRIQQALDEALITGHYRIEFRTASTPSNETRWLLAAANVLWTQNGSPYFVGMNLDITEQKRGAQALLRSEKLAIAGRLAASIAHEINNPLEAITNLLYLILQTPLNAEQHEYALIMRSELDRISQISTHTLRFHRQSTSAARTDITDLLDSVLALHEARLRNANVQIRRRLQASEGIVGFDGELRQVLANLVGNAIDAMHGVEGSHTLCLRSRDITHPGTHENGIQITVADNGAGMSPDTLARIFDAFFTTKGDTGTGLGLWVSMEIVKKHNGALRVRSSRDPKHRGTVFQLFLPATPAS